MASGQTKVKMQLDKNLSSFSNFSYAPLLRKEGNRTSGAEIAPQQVVVGMLLTVIDLVTFLGNMVVFICPVVEKRLRTVTYMFIMSLAMADLLVACLVMPFSCPPSLKLCVIVMIQDIFVLIP
ncbi:alpha-2Db adrenergic receptor-like [Spea bombifrons]|uniref:alpha-2Db adrenergic receptor-like n=1 Tax=Spea bombifrons TaxID=233779 RepID=UPI00234A2D2D|nr:alpha-2Db adrenergic receptor-like [Spea bombifrons]